MKKLVCFGILILLLLGLGAAQANVNETGLSFGVIGGWYLPGYGEINDDLEDINDYWGTNLRFRSGPILGFTASYDFTPNFRLRGELARFSRGTRDEATLSGSYWYYWWYYYWEETMDFTAELTVISLTLSGLYMFPSTSSIRPYLGAGIGQFITTLKTKGSVEHDKWVDGWHYYHDEYSFRDRDTDSPLGVQILVGIEGELSENISFAIEGRYTIAEAEFELDKIDWEPEVNLGGLTLTGMLKIRI